MKKRRDFLKLATTGAALAMSKPLWSDSHSKRKPNIIFIMADDLGYADLGCYGQKEIQTPNADRMAKEGIRFTDCYAGSTVCAPTRSVLMTGQHTGHTTIRHNKSQGKRIPLREEDVTIAQVLKDAGYATGIFGKWGLAEPGTHAVPNKKGFDEWFGYLNQKHAHSHYPEYLYSNNERVDIPANANDRHGQYAHELFDNVAFDFIRRHRDQPFFLYLPYTLPHGEFLIPDLGPYADKPWSEKARNYAAMVSRLDTSLGRILALLKELDIDENTIVFFTSDNGAGDRFEGTLDSSGPLRGMKRDLTEGGIRVPMIVRWPGKVPAGKVSDTIWYFPDVMPTCAALANATIPKRWQTDGVDVTPSLMGKSQDLSDRFLYWEFSTAIAQAGRWGKWKAINDGLGKPIELYDLSVDIDESNNIADAHPEIVAKFEAFFKEAHIPSPHWPDPEPKKAGA